MIWRCREHTFDVRARALVMGIVNVTPDSFSDGGRYAEPAAAIARCEALLEEGADLLDLGGESTRPGSAPVEPAEQWRRLAPVIQGLRQRRREAVISVDTRNADVARHALAAGAHVINDVSALADPGMAAVVAEAGAGLVLMHLRGSPATMQSDTAYDDVVAEVAAFLRTRMHVALAAGIDEAAIALDPGIGFGKSAEGSLALIAHTARLASLGRPVLVGASRKRFLGAITGGAEVHDRLEGSLAAAAIAVAEGARIVRVHDVRASLRAVRVADAIRAAR